MADRGEALEVAVKRVVLGDLRPRGIGAGTVAAPFNPEGMFRGWVTVDGDLSVASHAEVYVVERLAGRPPKP